MIKVPRIKSTQRSNVSIKFFVILFQNRLYVSLDIIESENLSMRMYSNFDLYYGKRYSFFKKIKSNSLVAL